MKQFIINEISQLNEVANYLLEQKTKIIVFIGQLGSGKTTLIKNMVKLFDQDLSHLTRSPTFNLVNQYQNDKHNILHLDLYRLEKKPDFIYEYLDEEANFILIEWPEIIKEYLIKNYKFLVVKISVKGNQRILEINDRY